jgi:hypothetical protein
MDNTSSDQVVAERLAELQLSFPVVAPRLLMNLEMDRDPYHGFETPVLRILAKHQVPILIDSYLRLGAFARDMQTNCGYRTKVKHRVTDGQGKTKEQKAEYFKNFSSLVAERISEGHPNKMAAATFLMTEQQHEELLQKIMPVLRELRSVPPGPNARGVRVVFCSLMETEL